MFPDFLVHFPNLIHIFALISSCSNQPGDELHLLVCHSIHVLSSLFWSSGLPLLTTVIITYSMEYVKSLYTLKILDSVMEQQYPFYTASQSDQVQYIWGIFA